MPAVADRPDPDKEPQPIPNTQARRIQELMSYKDPQATAYAKAIASEWGLPWKVN